MSWIHCEFTTELPREMGIAWKTPVGLREYLVSAVKNGVR